MSLYSEITTTYYELAKVHHPDHGGDQATFLQIHKGLVFDGMFRLVKSKMCLEKIVVSNCGKRLKVDGPKIQNFHPF